MNAPLKLPDEMTMAECREILFKECPHLRTRQWNDFVGTCVDTLHTDLNTIAAAMPQRWRWSRDSYVGGWAWKAYVPGEACPMVRIPDTGEECLDRARLAVACILRDKRDKQWHAKADSSS